MTQIVVRDAVEQQLSQATGAVEVLGSGGQVLGHFVPSLQALRLEPEIDDAELERRFAEGGGRPLADILADLEKGA